MESTTPRFPDDDDQPTPESPAKEEESDRDWVERMRALNFTGAEYEARLKKFALHTTGVFDAWFYADEISRRVSMKIKHHFELTELEIAYLRSDRGKIANLVDESTKKEVEHFTEKSMRAREWDPDGGSSLQTWFTNGGLFKVKNEVDRWRKQRARIDVWQFEVDEVGGIGPDLADFVASMVDLENTFRSLGFDKRERSAAWLISDAYSIRGAAGLTGLSVYTVRKVRDRLRKYYNDTEGGSHV
ncbi:hypothetical protein GCM10009853_072670 [Glycomyces scopariae]